MSPPPEHKSETAGILMAGSSYVFWGVMPLYWHLLSSVPPFEITVHRIFWCAIFAGIAVVARGRVRHVLALFRHPRAIATLAVTAVLIAVNWSTYIYSIATHQLVEASLGYYVTPLISIVLGVAILGEGLSRLRLVAIVLAGVAVVLQAFALGHFSWITLVLAFSFGLYGFFRKWTHVDPIDGLAVESWLMLPLTSGAILFWGIQGTGAFPVAGAWIDSLLILGGLLTALPLAVFAAGVSRIRLSTLGFLQYLNPSITLTLATLGFGEAFTRLDAVTFGCVWAALAIVAIDSRVNRAPATNPEPA
ncbi:MAG TPA: EamA family transporter RarD [Rhizomicrobium sp.]|nr:EamA family transporter RarD [Rhizomicrobium sp.]